MVLTTMALVVLEEAMGLEEVLVLEEAMGLVEVLVV